MRYENGEFRYIDLSPEQLASNIDVSISSGSSKAEIRNALKRDGVVYVLDGFKGFLHHKIHREILKEQGIPKKKDVIFGAILLFTKTFDSYIRL